MEKFGLTVLVVFAKCLTFAQSVSPASIPAWFAGDELEDLAVRESAVFENVFFSYDDLAPQPLPDGFQKININKATAEILHASGLFSTAQQEALLAYRLETGNFIALYELQTLSVFTPEDLDKLLPYLTVGESLDAFQGKPGVPLVSGGHHLVVSWKRFLQKSRGFKGETNPGSLFEGSPDRLVWRYRQVHSKKLQFGFTGEKDAGETLFRGSNAHGFDYLSGHLILKELTPWFRVLTVGDYTVNLGQGLLIHAGFGGTKSARVNGIKKMGTAIKPHASSNEMNYFRGVAMTFAPSRLLCSTVFFSRKKEDINPGDSLNRNETGDPFFTSILQSGLHRTAVEQEREKNLHRYSLGGNIIFERPSFRSGINFLGERFSLAWERNPAPYNRFFFEGKQTFSTSLDYTWIHRNFHVFGEIARSVNGGLGSVHGLFLSLDKEVELVLLHRHLEQKFQSLHTNIFSETSQGNNERGIYFGLLMSINRNWRWAIYFDLFRHPWLRFQTDSPSHGSEVRTRLTYSIRRKTELYAEVRTIRKEKNRVVNTQKTNALSWVSQAVFKVHFNYHLSSSLEWRSRLQAGFVKSLEGVSSGMQVQQDVLYKPKEFPFSFTTRLSLFSTDGYDLRFYSYENSLLYQYSIPPYFNQGSRFYINIRYKGIRNLTIEGRYAQFSYVNLDEIGTGVDAIDGSNRTEVAIQVQLKL